MVVTDLKTAAMVISFGCGGDDDGASSRDREMEDESQCWIRGMKEKGKEKKLVSVGPTLPHVIFLCGCRSGIATLGCMCIRTLFT
jgi:hypothetical protein